MAGGFKERLERIEASIAGMVKDLSAVKERHEKQPTPATKVEIDSLEGSLSKIRETLTRLGGSPRAKKEADRDALGLADFIFGPEAVAATNDSGSDD